MTEQCEICNQKLVDRQSTSGKLVCPTHCSKCGHNREFEDYLDFCSACKKNNGPCQ